MLSSATDRFALITSALCRAVAACLGRGLMDAAMIVLVWTRVRRAEGLFLALMERLRLGRYRGGWARVGGHPVGVVRVPAGVKRGRLPLRFGWLMEMMPYEAAGYAGQLRTLLAEPEMAALLQDVPQGLRILGPVCRMLGVELAGAAPRARADGAAAPSNGPRVRVARVRTARAREPVDLGRIPLPRGVLAAARRQGYGKLGG
jgi:hypothetical protein